MCNMHTYLLTSQEDLGETIHTGSHRLRATPEIIEQINKYIYIYIYWHSCVEPILWLVRLLLAYMHSENGCEKKPITILNNKDNKQ